MFNPSRKPAPDGAASSTGPGLVKALAPDESGPRRRIVNPEIEGVTLFSGFVFDLLTDYGHIEASCAPLFALAAGLDRSRRDALCPMSIYVDMCRWIEEHLGVSSVWNAGRALGERTFAQMAHRFARTLPTPLTVMHELVRITSVMIQDPHGRGWEVVSSGEGRVLMRRTFQFNCMLQEGLLLALAERSRVRVPRAVHSRCVRKGARACEYELLWLPTR
jgi:hypothetical protein